MRPAWAIVAGVLGAGALAWWQARDTPAGQPAVPGATATPVDPGASARPATGPALYRWRDEAGIVQITDIPPDGREYTVVDVAALERRNLIDPDPVLEAAR